MRLKVGQLCHDKERCRIGFVARTEFSKRNGLLHLVHGCIKTEASLNVVDTKLVGVERGAAIAKALASCNDCPSSWLIPCLNVP